MTRTYYAPAKINLWLRVFRSDDTGYHPLDTLFCAIDLADRIEIGMGEGIELDVHGADVGATEQNLAYRAALEYYRETGITPSLHIELHKVIPARAGLGGGSSDAAAVLRALQERHANALPDADLLALAARLGSDVPFFLCGSPLAQATARGEVLTPLPPLTQRHVLVVMPNVEIATRDAYRWLDEDGQLAERGSPLPKPLDWNDVERAAVNYFETAVFQRHPQLSVIRRVLTDSGAAIALLSGSGSALFGVFEQAARAEQARNELADRIGDVAIHVARTVIS